MRAPPRPGAQAEAFALRRLILRDYLAVERTRLANERTLLAYLRTAFALLAGAATLLHFFDDPAARLAGWLLLPAALGAGALGLARFAAVRRRIAAYAARTDEQNSTPPPPTPA